MAWRLRLLDDAGEVVGWATIDPLDYWVDESHPNADFLGAMLDQRPGEISVSAPVDWVTEDGETHPRMSTVVSENDAPPRDRLEATGSSCVHEGWVAGYEVLKE